MYREIRAICRMVKPRSTFVLALVAFTGAFFSPTYSSILNALLAVLVVLLVWVGTTLFNDYYDIDIDRRNVPSRPLAANEVSKKLVLSLAGLFYLFASLLAYLHSRLFTLLVLPAVFLGFQYSAPPLRLRRWGIVAALVVGIGITLAFLGGSASQHSISSEGIVVAVLLGALAFASSSVKDFRDMEGDKQAGICTLPIVLGYEKAVKLILLGMGAVYFLMLTPYFLSTSRLSTASLVSLIGVVNLMLIHGLLGNRGKEYMKRVYTYTHICGIAVVLVFLYTNILVP
jgi:chlorophyll synthase